MSSEKDSDGSFIQVPGSTDSSPLKSDLPPTRSMIEHNSKNNIVGAANLKERFALNSSSSTTTVNGSSRIPVSSGVSRKYQDDVAVIKKKYPTVKDNVLELIYKRKKGVLRDVVAFLDGLQVSHPRFFDVSPPPSQPPTAKSNGNLKKFNDAAIIKNQKSTSSTGRLASLSNSIPSAYKLNPQKKTLSIQQKFGITNHKLSEPDVQPRKRKLVRGSRNPQPDYSEDFMVDDDEDEDAEEPLLEVKKSKTILQKYGKADTVPKSKTIDLSDDEEMDAGASEGEDDSDADVHVESNVSQYELNVRTLEFLNTAQLRDICDIGGCTPEIAEKLIAKRPYQSLYEIQNDELGETLTKSNTKGRGGSSRKPNGLKIVEKTSVTLKGYDAVDSLVKKCSEYGKIIADEIKKWGINVTGEKGELEIVEVDSEKIKSEEVIDVDDDDGIKVVGTKRKLKGSYFTHKPKELAESLELKPYQQVGINWLNMLYQNNLSCILADEMGLGKTCQVISFFAYLKEINANRGPHLVVVPSSTLENWLREFQKFCPSLKVSPYYGSQKDRMELRIDLQETEFDVLVTTYNLATGNKDDVRFLRNQHFNVIVYDEGHMLKNSASERYRKLMRISGKFRLLLTGTPLQNNLKELISLLAFILPGIFREKQEDLQVLFNQKATTSNEDNKTYNPLIADKAIANAKTMMTPFILRRKKQQVLKNLPKKVTSIEYCDNTEIQQKIYDGSLKLVERPKDGYNNNDQSTNIIMKLRKASIHPLLFRYHYTNKILKEMAKKIMKEPQYVEANEQFIFEDMEIMTDFELNQLCEKFSNTIGEYSLNLSKEIYNSGKFKKLQELLPKFIIEGDRILIFSLFTQVLNVLEVLLNDMGIKFLRLDGSTSVELRQDIIDQFYQDESIKVFILSTKAGGFGINLACANNVIILDQSFNPHDDRQAEDRAHRVGQTRDVKVIRLISKNTIEENIYKLAQQKLQLDQSVSGDSGKNTEENSNKVLFKELLNSNKISKIEEAKDGVEI